MTGREQKVYYSYSQMSNKHSVPHEGPPSLTTRDQKGSGFAVPELEHNLQLLIDLTEQNILQVRVNNPSNNPGLTVFRVLSIYNQWVLKLI